MGNLCFLSSKINKATWYSVLAFTRLVFFTAPLHKVLLHFGPYDLLADSAFHHNQCRGMTARRSYVAFWAMKCKRSTVGCGSVLNKLKKHITLLCDTVQFLPEPSTKRQCKISSFWGIAFLALTTFWRSAIDLHLFFFGGGGNGRKMIVKFTPSIQ